MKTLLPLRELWRKLFGETTDEPDKERVSGRVMVVNAPLLFQSDLRCYLEDHGIVVQPHRSWRVAIRHARRSRPDLVIVYAVRSLTKGVRFCQELGEVPAIVVGKLDPRGGFVSASAGNSIEYFCKSNGIMELVTQVLRRLPKV